MSPETSGRCIIVGDVMMDISAAIDAEIAYASDTAARITVLPGGVAANTAAWMGASGADATLVGCVGPDEFGRSVRESLIAHGVQVHLREGQRRTGSCIVIVDHRRERTMFPDPGANAELTLDDITAHIGPRDHLHMSGYTVMNIGTRDAATAAIEHAVGMGATVSLDPSSSAPLRTHRTLIWDLLSAVDVVLANADEAAALTGLHEPRRALAALAERVPTAVVKMGARGVMGTQDGLVVERRARPVDVVDTTGAGDAFTAGFLPSWRSGRTLGAALDAGQELAASCVGRVGASPLEP